MLRTDGNYNYFYDKNYNIIEWFLSFLYYWLVVGGGVGGYAGFRLQIKKYVIQPDSWGQCKLKRVGWCEWGRGMVASELKVDQTCMCMWTLPFASAEGEIFHYSVLLFLLSCMVIIVVLYDNWCCCFMFIDHFRSASRYEYWLWRFAQNLTYPFPMNFKWSTRI